MTGLWDTTGTDVVRALAAERRTAGGVTSGLALTLIALVDEKRVREAEAAATVAAAAHPCRLLIVVRTDETRPQNRLDAEVVVGGRLGPCEAVVLRMQGRLALHAESVVMPLLAPDVPVVTWWHDAPPDRIAHDPLGVVAERRITDTLQSADPVAALRQRADDYAPGDTDLAWTRITPWRTLVASGMDTVEQPVTAVTVTAGGDDPMALLMGGWLAARLRLTPEQRPHERPGLRAVSLTLADGGEVSLTRDDAGVLLRRTGQADRHLPLLHPSVGDELAEELRRLDADQPYAAALAAATGSTDLADRPPMRTHIWQDPALAGAGS